jgi:hypothetical protein
MADSCPRCGEVVEYVGEPGGGGRLCPVCGERSSTAISATPAPPVAIETEDELSDPSPAPTYTLASPGQIGLATFLGGPMAGWLLIARNYAKLGRSGSLWAAVFVGVVVTAVAVAIAMVLPDNIGRVNFVPALVLVAITYGCAQMLQGAAIQEHLANGGQTASGWVIVGYLVIGIVLLLGPLLGGIILYEMVLGDETLAVSPQEEILYGRDVPVEEARTLGLVLQGQGFFDGAGEKTVALHKEGDEYVVALILKSGFQDAQLHEFFRTLATKISQAFDGKPVRIELCDQEMTVKKKLPAVRAGQ